MQEDMASEARLLRSAASGNMGAFSQLVALHRDRVLRTAYGIVGSRQEAEDVAQEVFIKVWKSLPSHQQKGSFSGWLYRIAVNTSIDALRRRRDDVSLDDRDSVPIGALEGVELQPERALLRNDVRRQVTHAIGSLPHHSRSVLILREYEQLSYKEIAEILQIPIGTVMSRLNYARRSLRNTLSREILDRASTGRAEAR